MTDPDPFPVHDLLRGKAEHHVHSSGPLRLWDGWPAVDLTHELSVYHIELEAQNEELQLTVLELEREHQLYHTLYEHAPTAYFTLDRDAHILNVNQAGERLLGFARSQLLQRRILQFVVPEQRAGWSRFLETLRSSGLAAPQSFTIIRRDNERLEVQLQGLTLPTAAQEHPTYLMTLTDITLLTQTQTDLEDLNATLEDRVQQSTQQLRELTAQFHHQARHDALTGLPNRAACQEELELALKGLHQTGQTFAVLFCDIDRFKRINDSLGHPAGDQVLRELARRLRTVIRPSDHVARLGGDEFAVLLHGVTDRAVVPQVIARLKQSLETPFVVEGQELFLQVSTGVLLVTEEYLTAEEVLRDVDLALYQAKRGGTERARIFEPAMRDEFRGRLELEAYLRHALERDELRVHYQPIVALKDGQLLGLEALIRWQHPQLGLLLPGAFVPLAEELGLIGTLDAWVLQTAVQQVSQWEVNPELSPVLWMNVNVSAANLTQIGQVTAQLVGVQLPLPWHVLTEMTERVLTQTADADPVTLRALHDAGVELVVDDFGTGFSSLGSLHRFPLRMLKIDRSLVAALEEHRELIRTITAVGHTLGLTVVAEGIETEAQRTQLMALGITVGQGYLFAPPLPPEQIDLYLNSATGLS